MDLIPTGRILPTVSVRLFRRGDIVGYNGYGYTVDHIIVSRGKVMVMLTELGQAIDSRFLDCNNTEVNFEKMRGRK